MKTPLPSSKGMMDIISAIDIQKKYWSTLKAVLKNPEFKNLVRLVFPTVEAVKPRAYWRMSEYAEGLYV